VNVNRKAPVLPSVGAERTCRLSGSRLQQKLSGYGFTEVSDVRIFLACVAGDFPRGTELIYIHNKLHECLRNHDNGSDYFTGLRGLVKQVDDALFALNKSEKN
jgi:hypothetical protein